MKNWITILLFLTFSVFSMSASHAKNKFYSIIKNQLFQDNKPGEASLKDATVAHDKLKDQPEDINTCNSRLQAAGNSCLESKSPLILESVNTLNGILATIDAANVTDSCSKFSQAMQVAKMGMTAFTVQCSGFKIACQSACSTSQKKIADRIKECMNSKASASVGMDAHVIEFQCNNLYKDQLDFADKANSVCSSYAKTLATSVASVVTAWQRSTMGKTCADRTAAAQPIDCTIAANAENVTCICQKDPRATGCPGASTGSTVSATAPTQITNGGTDGAVADTDGNLQLTRDLGANSKITPGTATSSNSPGTGTGVAVSGDGGSSGGIGSSAPSKSADGSKGNAKGLNANILSGDFGGGGGGSRGGGSGVEAGASNAYRAFMPGGAKDPSNSRGTASAAAASGVTGAGGADNWQKVRSRYIDTKGTLLGD